MNNKAEKPGDIHTEDGYIDVKYGYCKTIEELGERMQYEFRYPSPGRHHQGWEVLDGLSGVELRGVAMQYLMMKGFRRIRWYGFLSTRRGKWLFEQLGVRLRKWTNEDRTNECPYCGGYLKFMGFVNDEVRAPPAVCPN